MTYQANHQQPLNGNNAIKYIKKGGGWVSISRLLNLLWITLNG